jgi:hypothetical protein
MTLSRRIKVQQISPAMETGKSFNELDFRTETMLSIARENLIIS